MNTTSILFLLIISLSQTAEAHEESCSFRAVLKNVNASTKRSPQADSVILIADVEVKAAESSRGSLSYLDCKHWVNQNLASVEIVASKGTNSKRLQETQVQLEFRRRDTQSGNISSWRLATK